jgi:hypothetical protein
MNSDIENLAQQVKQATDYQSNKRMLREKIQTELHMPFNGGLFKITPELLAFVATWPIDELYLEDTYQNPIEIDKQVFLVKAQQHYHAAMNTWHQQHDELKRIRKV